MKHDEDRILLRNGDILVGKAAEQYRKLIASQTLEAPVEKERFRGFSFRRPGR